MKVKITLAVPGVVSGKNLDEKAVLANAVLTDGEMKVADLNALCADGKLRISVVEEAKKEDSEEKSAKKTKKEKK